LGETSKSEAELVTPLFADTLTIATMKSRTGSFSHSVSVASRAVEYVRISTEQFSNEKQREIIREYAQQQGMIIVQTYTDAAKSGPWKTQNEH
jgi:resolvase-like protein